MSNYGKTIAKLESTEDAFGNIIRLGSNVVYYTGNEARLKRGKVVEILDKSTQWYGRTHKNHRVIIHTDNHDANVGHLLCMLEE